MKDKMYMEPNEQENKETKDRDKKIIVKEALRKCRMTSWTIYICETPST